MQNNWWFFFLSISFDDKFIKADTKVVPPDAPHATQSTSVSVLCPHQAGVRTKKVEKVVSGGATVTAASSAATACASTTLAAAALATASFSPPPPSPPPPSPLRQHRCRHHLHLHSLRLPVDPGGGHVPRHEPGAAWLVHGLVTARASAREPLAAKARAMSLSPSMREPSEERTVSETVIGSLSVSGFTVCTDTLTSSLPILRRRSGQHTLLSGHREKNT